MSVQARDAEAEAQDLLRAGTFELCLSQYETVLLLGKVRGTGMCSALPK